MKIAPTIVLVATAMAVRAAAFTPEVPPDTQDLIKGRTSPGAYATAVPGLGDVDDVGGGWYVSTWFGPYYGTHYPWVYHRGVGWTYVSAVGDDAAWLYSPSVGWLYTDGDYYPALYRSGTSSWVYSFGATGNGWFYDYTMQKYWHLDTPPTQLAVLAHRRLDEAKALLLQTAQVLPNHYTYPDRGRPGGWKTVDAGNWVSGFWPGCLWFMYDYTGEEQWKTMATDWMLPIESQKNNTTTHDLGFMIHCSFGQAYRLTGNTAYRDVVLKASASLETRYSSKVGAMRSWSWGKWDDGNNFTIIIDNMMNLEMPLWAAKQPGGKAVWRDQMIQHAITSARDLYMADGSCHHCVIYNGDTGAVKSKVTHQGYSDDSAWARGQAWGIYGFTVLYRETGDVQFLNYAKRGIQYYMAHLPADQVPYWDFRHPNIPNVPRDTSATALAASALLELSTLTSGEDSEYYRSSAEAMLMSLCSDTYFAVPGYTPALLAHGTGNAPGGDSDTGLTWGDYYFMEALLRYLRIEGLHESPEF